jgi:hypothetical protein
MYCVNQLTTYLMYYVMINYYGQNCCRTAAARDNKNQNRV